jgi:ferritin-like protein
MGHESWHEPYEDLTPRTRDMHRAIISLMEELEAIDWYQQRADVTPDADLKAVVEHNRDEEIEHAMMTLEWIRRRSPKFDENLRLYLWSDGPITEVEEKMKESGGGSGAGGDGGEGASGDSKSKSTKSKPSSKGKTSSKAGDGSLGIGGLGLTKEA